jgi:hypothetical protein
MKISTQFHGILTDWVGAASASFDLPEDATYADLMDEIGRRFGRNMPEQLWDREKNSFNKTVQALGKGRTLNAANISLLEEETITFILMIAGG